MKKKEHNISAIIVLIAGAVSVLCCMLNRIPILLTLKYVLAVLILFLIIGRVAEGIINKTNAEVEEAAQLAEEEAKKAAEEEAAFSAAALEEPGFNAGEDGVAKGKGA